MEHFLPPRKPTSFSVMTDGDTALIIFSSEIFLELKPRMFECKIAQFPSLFIELVLFVQSFLDFLLPRLVLGFSCFRIGKGGHLGLGRPFAGVVVEATGFHLGLLGRRWVGRVVLDWVFEV